ncbi:hypothetical protein SV7mr_29740 [Stieleria bergensis]|uniref:Uncharacterized protein n=1 Tax=Stieleria bergensis TaxID=2528025 RepID=A0A517SWK6_9BACT|nr:hypothetical protein SV7mr_29740 [Planctomycetes bacterium SV_7m_r]
MSDNESQSADDQATTSADKDQGPGLLPALIALVAIGGMLMLITFAGMAWWIFSNQSKLALPALRDGFIPQVEQSRLSPEQKTPIIEHLDAVVEDLASDQLESWQVTGVMQRLQRLPILQWGHLQVLKRFIEDHPNDFPEDAALQIDRVFSGISDGQITGIDASTMLLPVIVSDQNLNDADLIDPLETAKVAEVVTSARQIADRVKVPDTAGPITPIDVLVRRQIEAGRSQGGF